MNDMNLSRQKSSWETFWAAIAATAAAIAAVMALVTASDARKDTEKNRAQQRTLSQGAVMSSCMNEYFDIRRDATDKWSSVSTNVADRKRIGDRYSERRYGLHFEEYHLFQRKLIPLHIYAVWLRSLKQEIDRKDEAERPKLDIGGYIDTDPNEDCNVFLRKVLSSKEDKIDDLVAAELKSSTEKLYDP